VHIDQNNNGAKTKEGCSDKTSEMSNSSTFTDCERESLFKNDL